MIEKVLKNLDFIECLVKLAHIKNILYTQGVAKISQLLQLKHNLLGYSDNNLLSEHY